MSHRLGLFQSSIITLITASLTAQMALSQTTITPAQPIRNPATQPPAPSSMNTPVVQTPPNIRMPKEMQVPEAQDASENLESDTAKPSAMNSAMSDAAYRRAVKSGMAALTQENWSDAATALSEAHKLNPKSMETAYNLGVAKFRQGDYTAAEQLFQESAQSASADIAAKSMFNEGNSIYANVVQGQASTPDLKKGIEKVQKAFTHFKDSSAANPSDDDSAANAETAFKLIRQMKEELKKQQEQQKKDEKQDEKQDQQKQDQKQDQQQQKEDEKNKQSEQGKQEQKESQQQKQDSDKSQSEQDEQKKKDQEQQSKEDQAQKDGQEKDAQPEQQKQDEPQDSKKQDEQKQDASAADEVQQAGAPKLDKQETARLLQMVRDKEKQRNADKKAKVTRTSSAPAGKDW